MGTVRPGITASPGSATITAITSGGYSQQHLCRTTLHDDVPRRLGCAYGCVGQRTFLGHGATLRLGIAGLRRHHLGGAPRLRGLCDVGVLLR